MAGGQRLISWLHPCSTGNVVLNMRSCAHGPLMGHPNWVGCDRRHDYFSSSILLLEHGSGSLYYYKD
jgi:hypothetical protein